MTTAPVELRPVIRQIPPEVDKRRGTGGMMLVIVTEASMFLILFVSYWFLSNGDLRWPGQEPPKLTLALVMLLVLGSSSIVLTWGERQVERARHRAARWACAVTVGLGSAFLVLQSFEYRDHLKTLTPRTNAYGSLFYTITAIHGLHVLTGILLLVYVLLLPELDPLKPPHRPLHNAAMFWHFVDVVWIFIVAILYVVPNIR
jgi:heme/copper-type cytochrome/quinol oxidase subunit 3